MNASGKTRFDDPLLLFDAWYREALDAGMKDPDAMTLATADSRGRPAARIVLLKAYDSQGFVFYTNYRSRKGRELEVNPHASLLFFWTALRKQVRIEGPVIKVPAVTSDRYFRTRPRGSRLGAWASPQSQEIDSWKVLEEAYDQAKKRFAGSEIPRPAHWGGYLLQPERFDFWIEKKNRLHDRFMYAREGDSWIMKRLAP